MTIYYFNPGHETAVQNASPYYTMPANLVAMQRELAMLPAWYANPDSSEILSVEDIDKNWIDKIRQGLNFEIRPIQPKELRYRKGADISLWGISPQARYIFGEWEKAFETRVNLPQWRDQYLYLSGRRAGRDCLEKLIETLPDEIPEHLLPTYHRSIKSIEEAVMMSPLPLLAKAPYSSSGRGLLRLPVEGLTRTERQILQGMLNKQGELSLETKLDKQIDFAMEFLSDGKGGIQFAGYSLFRTNEKGAYLGNYLDSQDNIQNYLLHHIDSALLNDVKANLTKIIQDTYCNLYEGCIGVDMLIYNDMGTNKLHPCVEINMRYNMGYLACQFCSKYLAKDSKGFYYIEFSAKEGEAYLAHKKMEEQHPALFSEGKLQKGYLPLCPVDPRTKYRAYVLIEE